MKYAPEAYAEAFVQALKENPAQKNNFIKRFFDLVKRSGDLPGIDKIFNLIAKKITASSGGRTVSVEFARELPKKLAERLVDNFSDKDYMKISVKPELVAGARILIDGERELDLTMARKLKKLFL